MLQANTNNKDNELLLNKFNLQMKTKKQLHLVIIHIRTPSYHPITLFVTRNWPESLNEHDKDRFRRKLPPPEQTRSKG